MVVLCLIYLGLVFKVILWFFITNLSVAARVIEVGGNLTLNSLSNPVYYYIIPTEDESHIYW